MSDINQLIEQIVAGDNSTAKDTFDALISERALGYLDEYKKQMSSTMFGGISEAKKETAGGDDESDYNIETKKEDDDDEEEDDDKEDKKEMKKSVDPRTAILNKVRAKIGL